MQKVQRELQPPCASAVTPGGGADFPTWFDNARAEVDAALAAHLSEVSAAASPHSRLPAAVQYSLHVGGKRVRPILVLECCRVCDGAAPRALPAALALEFVHTFSLIHDDLPAMDNDDLRRGQPTSHKVFGEGLAILAGDWLLAHAFALLASPRAGGDLSAALSETLAAGALRMIEGQGADLEGMARPTEAKRVQYIHEHKTAALIQTACRLGGLCAAAPPEVLAAVSGYGRHLGLAFQIADDILDATGTVAKLGKAVGKDAAAAKQTYPAAFGLDESRRQARHAVNEAVQALEPFGARADRLRALAWFVVERDR
jgi:geranylgeranyl diphosphate synthase type II